MSASEPDEDEWGAQRDDLLRLLRLVEPHLPDHSAPLIDAFPHMSEADRAEALAILDRVGDITEDPETTRARQRSLLNHARLEAALLSIAENPGPAFSDNGQILRSPDGSQIPNEKIRAEVRELLTELRRQRARLSGVPLTSDTEST